MFINNFKITSQWVKFSDLLGGSIDETATYFIQNNGGNAISCYDGANTPENKSNDGIILLSNNIAEYKKGEGELYLKTIGYNEISSTISISNDK